MKAKIDAQTRMDPGASSIVDGVGPVLPAWVAEERNRISGQQSTEGEEHTFSDLVREAKVRELAKWGNFRVSSPAKCGTQPKDLVDTRWVLTWKEVDGEKTVKTRIFVWAMQILPVA